MLHCVGSRHAWCVKLIWHRHTYSANTQTKLKRVGLSSLVVSFMVDENGIKTCSQHGFQIWISQYQFWLAEGVCCTRLDLKPSTWIDQWGASMLSLPLEGLTKFHSHVHLYFSLKQHVSTQCLNWDHHNITLEIVDKRDIQYQLSTYETKKLWAWSLVWSSNNLTIWIQY